ncbi:glycosyltransferase family 4 protein [Dellaglioa algida]|uniref:glycosyltransferase family 4 protein n=1 Tax=Dellaglioa algida TaxID=105612 RepID=UPI0024C49E5D|nr:glycosyltransferase family 4 protein [Dellaglioa algida]MDK1724715.1 glycosyltransferase family 4 protein [Dellaglioa algida]MDK1738745.1 glycosyltransferase family 4 protein [Dellaglioa algida]
MNIGIFTDTYFPQVSGVATSIKTLRNELEKEGHTVYIFTTTDPHVDKTVYERNIFRFSSIPFVSFTDRRIAVRGLFQAYQVAKELNLDVIHTQTEFSMGWIGKFVARNLKVPCLHTYHTMYEDYLHYIANGKLLKPYHVKQMTKTFAYHMSGIVAPSDRVQNLLQKYGVKSEMRIIPTGVDISQFEQLETEDYRAKLGIAEDRPVMLALSRLAFEKNTKEIIDVMPAIVEKTPDVLFLIVGDGPARETLEEQVVSMNLESNVRFTGEVDNDEVFHYYQLADLFISASVTESQGLTFIEALAAGTPVLAKTGDYTDELMDQPEIGKTFASEDEMVTDIIDYLNKRDAEIDPEPRLNKLKEISAATFGSKVAAFYQDAQIQYVELEEEDDEISHL